MQIANYSRINSLYLLSLLLALTSCGDPTTVKETKTSREKIGESLFFDTTLSEPAGQSCASCHLPQNAFSEDRAVSKGARSGIFGKRSAPSLLYTSFIPPLHYDRVSETLIGGLFVDGRANDLKDQVQHPLLSAREMNNGSKATVVNKVMAGSSVTLIKEVYGEDIFSNVDTAFDAIADSIATFEMTDTFAPFSSKYDLYLNRKIDLTDQELRGLSIFNGKANCAACHPSTPSDGHPPLFTDFTYDNLGAPKNPNNPFYSQPKWNNPEGASFIDHGLSDTTGDTSDEGKFRVPTLRNLELTAPYFHNGSMQTIEDVIEFYNSRDSGNFPEPEIDRNVNRSELGNLGLTKEEMADLAVFLKTLTDGYDKDN